MENTKSEGRHDILVEILQTFYRINMMGLVVNLVWEPHYGVTGNKETIKMAKEAAKGDQVD